MKGLLLLNLGTPDSPAARDVGRYLTEFLMDPFVVDIALPLRWILVNALIVPRRKFASGHAYKKIWKSEGSPLAFYLRELQREVQRRAGESLHVEIGMRYGNPSLHEALRALMKAGVDDLTVFPLYPQYAESSTRSSQEKTVAVAKRLGYRGRLRFAAEFFDAPEFIAAAAAVAAPKLAEFKADHVLMSFHGLPMRHILKISGARGHCFADASCCDRIIDRNRRCYRAQCFATARGLAGALGLNQGGYTVGFQSRLGRTPWIRPFTDELLTEFAAKGVKRLAVICPSFTADCLETLEEIGIRGRADFKAAGGEDLLAVPCMNGDPRWAKAVLTLSNRRSDFEVEKAVESGS